MVIKIEIWTLWTSTICHLIYQYGGPTKFGVWMPQAKKPKNQSKALAGPF